MKAEKYLAEDVVVKMGIEALVAALGPVEAARFMSIPKPKKLESVKRHRMWQRSLDKDSFFDDVFSL
jgi:hypothetical protein